VLAWTIAGMPAAWIAGMPVVGLVVQAGWRATWLAVPMLAGVAALALVLLRPSDPRSCRSGDAVAAWRRPAVARFAAGELLANAAWAGVLIYAGALMLASYPVSPSLVALGFAMTAAAMLPGTFAARGHAARATPALLSALTACQAGAVIMLGAVRPTAAVTLALLAAMSFVNGWRSMVASALGMDSAPEDKLAVMAMRAAANQFGYLLGAAAGGLALAAGGFPALGLAFAVMFVLAIVVHVTAALRRLTPAASGSSVTGRATATPRTDSARPLRPGGEDWHEPATEGTTSMTSAVEVQLVKGLTHLHGVEKQSIRLPLADRSVVPRGARDDRRDVTVGLRDARCAGCPDT
jgi:predicted MFS family arabinose efflux permease